MEGWKELLFKNKYLKVYSTKWKEHSASPKIDLKIYHILRKENLINELVNRPLRLDLK